jgi:NADH-quinone oxidoreductase subunit M
MRDYGGLAARHPWMVTFFVITGLAAVGLPMLSGFVGEFLILSGTMQSFIAHHVLWTVVGTTGVIFSAAYMLGMIQRVFYGSLGLRPEEVSGWDLKPREHLELWPLALLFLIMGIFSPYWTKAIDPFSQTVARGVEAAVACPLAQHCTARLIVGTVDANGVAHYSDPLPPGFVDPNLGAAALGKPAPAVNKGARY